MCVYVNSPVAFYVSLAAGRNLHNNMLQDVCVCEVGYACECGVCVYSPVAFHVSLTAGRNLHNIILQDVCVCVKWDMHVCVWPKPEQ